MCVLLDSLLTCALELPVGQFIEEIGRIALSKGHGESHKKPVILEEMEMELW